ncbi:MAG: hypothetical protein JWN65_197 [Solirubrobacterales bacterium]|nr:hypothetical protein [Solirubrobacterales bacterium]
MVPPMSPSIRTHPVRSRLVAVVALVGAGLVVGGCGSDSGDAKQSDVPARLLDTQTVATAIKQSVQDKRGRRVHVVCPQGIPQRKDFQFTCTATSKATGTTKFLVQQADDKGNVTYAAQ